MGAPINDEGQRIYGDSQIGDRHLEALRRKSSTVRSFQAMGQKWADLKSRQTTVNLKSHCCFMCVFFDHV